MADVTKIDIDGVQWDIKDQVAHDRISTIEQLITQKNTIRRDIVSPPIATQNCLWAYMIQQLGQTDWSFLTVDMCAYGKYEIIGVCWGTYQATKFTDNSFLIKGTLLYDKEPHVFEVFYDAPNNHWHWELDGEGLKYLQNNILITYKMSHVNNGFTIPAEITVRNVAKTTIGNLYNALDTCDLLNRPSTGIIAWDLTRTHNGVDLPKIKRGFPQIASADELDISGSIYLQNVRIGEIDHSTAMWWCTWNDGNIYEAGNMYGEDFEGIVKTVTMVFAV